MDPMFQILSIFCAGVFFGIAVYMALVQHPTMLSMGMDFATRFFGAMYLKAAPLQVLLSVLGAFAGMFQWLLGGGILWLIGAGCLIVVTIYSLVMIKPINDKLLTSGSDTQQAEQLLKGWAKLHWLRVAMIGAALMLYLLASYG